MSYRININCQGGRRNRIGNPLVKLDDRTFETREEACKAIYAALEGVIQGDGCEMVDQSTYLSEDEYWLDRYCSACHAYILREGYATEGGVTATVIETLSLIDKLHRGVWPVNAVLRWNTREDITIESGLIPNEYAHEIDNIKNDGAFGFDFEDAMSEEDISNALDFICSNYEDGVSATVEECK